ncbi:hypothetical protein [Mycolicibacterium sphagni]|uniref:hypothetical protein n=1 Tax=Mycolicibacterium sphagni TaxID=1786 RepID=UPI0021F3054A|nr:hypothetical protein [Mycolicibacterium sphagni]MCV7174855.1 hypothetical protein [Mycolicibacterium sphagni]
MVKGHNAMETFIIGTATVTVEHDGANREPGSRESRQRYSYSIVTPEWRYDGNDIHSGVGAVVDIADAARSLFSFLGACAEWREYRTRNGYGGENADLFPEHVGQWAEQNSDEISMLAMDPADLD